MVLGFGKWVGKKILKSKKKSTFIKDKSGTITGVKPGSFKKKKKSWKQKNHYQPKILSTQTI